MKLIKLFTTLSLLTLLVACGKSDDKVATSGVAVPPPAGTCTTPGYVYSPSNGCAPAQYGQPPGYNGGYNGGQQWQPVNNVYVPQTGCQTGYYQYPYGGGYGNYGCQPQRSYRWYFYGGYYYFF